MTQNRTGSRRRACLVTLMMSLSVVVPGAIRSEHQIKRQESFSREDSIHVGENIQVGRGLERPLTEPYVTSHPNDANHLLGVAIVADVAEAFSDHQTCATFLSTDGGRTWGLREFEVARCADPWVAITPAGDAVFAALGKHRSISENSRKALLMFHSQDGGQKWNDSPVDLGWPHDHPTIAIDKGQSERRGWLYVVANGHHSEDQAGERWNVDVYRSTDGGRTFQDIFTFTSGNLINNTDIPVVLANGTLLVPFVEHHRYVPGDRRVARLERRPEKQLRSYDGGDSFSAPLFVTEECGWGWRWLDVDLTSGPFRDRVYLTCIGHSEGEIVLQHSPDGGERWTDPVRVRAAANGSSFPRIAPSLAVNKDGVVGIAWVDGNIDPSIKCYEIFFTASVDGGLTFLPEQVVSSKPSCPDSALSGAAFRRWPAGGDYFGLTAAADGRFHALWSDARSGRYELWTAAITVAGRAEKEP